MRFSAAACLFASILSVRPSDELGAEEGGWESVPFDLTVTPPLPVDAETEEDPELFRSFNDLSIANLSAGVISSEALPVSYTHLTLPTILLV